MSSLCKQTPSPFFAIRDSRESSTHSFLLLSEHHVLGTTSDGRLPVLSLSTHCPSSTMAVEAFFCYGNGRAKWTVPGELNESRKSGVMVPKEIRVLRTGLFEINNLPASQAYPGHLRAREWNSNNDKTSNTIPVILFGAAISPISTNSHVLTFPNKTSEGNFPSLRFVQLTPFTFDLRRRVFVMGHANNVFSACTLLRAMSRTFWVQNLPCDDEEGQRRV
ncbi:hypothetical protein HYALB_00008010 [Hymenoscyphus albidus]|uniref:Uncharacterized protein n=1 Tax=Hymenoscyphus albidus TaxID=595503 RepID=A0A9N9LFE7_9HELO|nr:hypothetical protein HYALB_00008010 [Hymenoscyphus albidus]